MWFEILKQLEQGHRFSSQIDVFKYIFYCNKMFQKWNKHRIMITGLLLFLLNILYLITSNCCYDSSSNQKLSSPLSDNKIIFVIKTQFQMKIKLMNGSKINATPSFIFFCILLFCLPSFTLTAITASDTKISSVRNSYRSNICSFFSATYTSDEISKSQAYINQYSYLSASQIQTILYDKNFSSVSKNTIIIAAPHAIALIFLILLSIPLCCCCCCPCMSFDISEKHPACKKCRKPQKQMYSKCQLKWTSYIALILFLTVLVGSILSLIQGIDIVNYFNDLGCKMTGLGDDLINGRLSPTVDNRFFVGLNPLSTELTTYNGQMTTTWTQCDNSLTNADAVKFQQNLFQTLVNSTYTSYSNLVYSTAFSTDGENANYVNVNSQFKDMYYGPVSNSSSILGKIYSSTNTIFTQINNMLDPMIAAWGRLTATTQAGVTIQITNTIAAITTINNDITNFLDGIGPLFDNSTLLSQIITGLKAFYGAFFALSILGVISAIILTCCSVVKVRLIMYFACGIMYFLAFISFIILIVLAVLAPNISQACAYVDTQLKTSASTVTFFNKMGMSSFSSIFSTCMSDGTGETMINISPPFDSSFKDLLLIATNTLQFNIKIPNYSTTNLNTAFTSAATIVDDVLNARSLDINDTISLDFINKVRTITYPTNINCNSINVNGDSWFPSLSLYSCPGGKAIQNPCANLASTAAGGCPLGCYQIMKQMESASGDGGYNNSLGTRYGLSCNYYTYIKNLQNNWNYPRKIKMNSVQSNLNNLQNNVNLYDTKFKSSQSNISAYTTILKTNFDSTTNVTSGSFNGLDCRVIGESITDFRNSVCVGLLNSIYYNIICLALISYGSLLLGCFATCAGVRHFKHLQRMQVHVGYKGVPVSISDQRIFDK